MRQIKYLIRVQVFLMLLIILSACGKSYNSEAEESKLSFVTTPFVIDSQLGNIDSISVHDNTYYLLYNEGEESYVLSVNQERGEISEYDNKDKTITAICAGKDGSLYYAENISASVENVEATYSCLNKLGTDESVEFGIRIDSLLLDDANSLYVDQILTDNDGRIYIHWGSGYAADYKQGINILDGEGEALFTLNGDFESTVKLVATGDMFYALIDNNKLEAIDVESQGWGESITLPDTYSQIYSGLDNELYLDDGTNLYRYIPETEEIQTVLNWVDCTLSGSPICLLSNQDGSFLVSTGEDVLLLSEATDNVLSEKTVINLATDNAAGISEAVMEFNKLNDLYRIKITEYSEEDITKLNTEITTGNVPDIFCFNFNKMGTSSLATNSTVYAARGLFADLYTFIDSDEELNRESFIPNILKAAESDGKLYELPSSFWIDVVVGSSDVVGKDIGWTFDEMLEVLNKYPEAKSAFGPYMTQELLLQFMLAYNADDYIDWGSGECYFDSEEFLAMLEFVNRHNGTFPEDETRSELELISNGEQLLVYGTLARANAIQEYYQYFNTEDITIIGFPTSEGAGNAIVYNKSFSISATSTNADIAWKFIRNFYLEDYIGGTIPINAEALEKYIDSQAEDEGVKYIIGTKGEEGYWEIDIGKATEYNVARFKELIYSLTKVSRYDTSLYEIVMEEAASYFSGDKTVEEVVGIIQNRVQTYVDEQS